MFEKLKDLLYETSDLLLGLVILLLMTSVITWQITDSLALTSQNSINIEETEDTTEPLPVEPVHEVDEPSGNIEEDEPKVVNVIPEDDQSSVPILETKPITTTNPSQDKLITVEVPNGTPGMGIANILRDKGLIHSSQDFIARVDELKLGTKLKSGTYKIETGATLDEIIYILSGQKQ